MSAVWRCYGGRVREGMSFISKHIGCYIVAMYSMYMCYELHERVFVDSKPTLSKYVEHV